jgi:integrase
VRVKAHPSDGLRPDQVHFVAEYLRGTYRYGELYRLLFLTGCNTGLRASDLRRLSVGQMDAGELDLEEKKTGKTRHIVLNACIRQVYAEYRRRAGVLYWAPPAFVFELQRGGAACVKYIHLLISEACASLGYGGSFGSHTMRKSFAREIYRKTKSRRVLQELLHHSKPSVTDAYIDGSLGGEPASLPGYTLAELYNLVFLR